MHGDFSPKNMLHRDGRLVVLDCEVACYADAAFDLSFLLNHLLLKGLYHAPARTELPSLFAAVVKAYSETMGPLASQVLEPAAGLLPMLLLARVDGKSPVEYLTPAKQAHAREFAIAQILSRPLPLSQLAENWYKHL